MAWVVQTFDAHEFEVQLEHAHVEFEFPGGFRVTLEPGKQVEAHDWAMMLRRAARRLEEIGQGLS